MRYKSLIILLLLNAGVTLANDYEGFNLIRSGYYSEALKYFKINTEPTKQLGLQYCYLRMNNVNYDDKLTLSLLYEKILPDSILELIAIDIIKSYHNDLKKQEIGCDILNQLVFNSPINKVEFYSELAQSYRHTNNYQKAIEYYKKQIDIISENQNRFIDPNWKYKECITNIHNAYKLLNDSSSWKLFYNLCKEKGITIDTTFYDVKLNAISKPNNNWDVMFFHMYPSFRDSLAYKAQIKNVPLAEKLKIYIDLAEYDSLNNTPQYKGGGYVGDLVKIAQCYKESDDYIEEEKYLILAYKNKIKSKTLFDRYDIEEILVQLVDNALCQKEYQKALLYENMIDTLNSEIFGFNENNFFPVLPLLNMNIKYNIISGIGDTWSNEVFDLSEHIIRKASILYELNDIEQSLEMCHLSDSILKSYRQFKYEQTKRIKYDTYPQILKAKCYLKKGDLLTTLTILEGALEKNMDFYWNVALLPQTDNMGFITIYSEADRQQVLLNQNELKEFIYSISWKLDADAYNSLCYNQCLFDKQILLETANIINDIAIKSGNIHYSNISKQKEKQEQFSNVFSIDSIEKIINNEERLLINDISSQINNIDKSAIMCNFDEVMNKLHSEVAIEYFTAPLNADSTMYCALLLRNNSEYPELIPLFEEKEVQPLINTTTESLANFTYSYKGNGAELTKKVWSKILPYIKQGETVYFAPSGLLHQLAIEALPYDEKHTMADMFNLVRLSSTREIVTRKDELRCTTATLYGGIQYNVDTTKLKEESKKYPEVARNRKRSLDNETLNRGTFDYLPGTKTEVEKINSMLHQNNLQVRLYTAISANEESFKALSGKHQNILHIATHGFFWADSTARKKDYFSQHKMMRMGDNMPTPPTIDPLNRCGLLFAGANTALQGRSKDIPEGVQDGILTAKEISLLDLRDADLVVLSACETGKGEITGDGVFGLQRAFKQAGARTIIMSLWPVNDAATQLLMTEFYKNWITKRQSKREAFRNAQNTVRSQYPEPVYWAGFIMLD